MSLASVFVHCSRVQHELENISFPVMQQYSFFFPRPPPGTAAVHILCTRRGPYGTSGMYMYVHELKARKFYRRRCRAHTQTDLVVFFSQQDGGNLLCFCHQDVGPTAVLLHRLGKVAHLLNG